MPPPEHPLHLLGGLLEGLLDEDQTQIAETLMLAVWLEIDALSKDRDAWAEKWMETRRELANIKHPGMTGVVLPTGA